MAPPDIFHIGILVADLDAALERWSSALGLRFAAVMSGAATILDPEPRTQVTRAAYSIDGPPHLELVEATESGHTSLAANGGEGLHHLGVWAPPQAEYLQTPQGVALPPAFSVCAFGGDVPTMWHTDRRALNGVDLEMVSDTLRPVLAGMLRGS